MRKQIENTLNAELSELSTSSLQRDRLYQNAIGGERMNRKSVATFHPARRIAILLAAMMALTCVAGAAFYPQMISWFTNQYGQEWGAWMEKGNVALPDSSVEANGAVFMVDEVLVRGRGLYVLGRIKAEPGHMLIEQDCSANEPFGYNIHHGETAPEGTPTIAQKAAEDGAILHYVSCNLEGIGVNGGTVLQPGSWGYATKVQKDGSIVFSMEVEDGMVVEPGKEYTLVLQAKSYGTLEDNAINFDDLAEKTWSFTVIPEQIEQN